MGQLSACFAEDDFFFLTCACCSHVAPALSVSRGGKSPSDGPLLPMSPASQTQACRWLSASVARRFVTMAAQTPPWHLLALVALPPPTPHIHLELRKSHGRESTIRRFHRTTISRSRLNPFRLFRCPLVAASETTYTFPVTPCWHQRAASRLRLLQSLQHVRLKSGPPSVAPSIATFPRPLSS
jgi:hypothetical protein